MIRSFLAISLPEDTADALMDLQTGVRNAGWIADDVMHITVAFLGACTPAELSELDAGLKSIRLEKCTVKLQGAGAFGGRAPRLLYAALEANEPLHQLRTKVVRVARDAGIFIERRKYIPHVTLARCGSSVIPSQAVDWTIKHARWGLTAFDVHHLSLYRSDLGTGAPVYTEMARYPML